MAAADTKSKSPLDQMEQIGQRGVTIEPPTGQKKATVLDTGEDLLRRAGALTGTSEAAKNDKLWTRGMALTLGWSLLGFTLLVMVLATALLWKRNASAVQIVRLFLLVLIISLSCFLVVVGYDEKQLMPVIGLFGAICGYLLGRETRPASETANAGTEPPEPPSEESAASR